MTDGTDNETHSQLSILKPPPRTQGQTFLRASKAGTILTDYARSTLDWAFACDASLCLSQVSDGFTGMTGLPVRQVIGAPLEDVLFFRDVEEAAVFMARLSRGDAFHREPVALKTSSGTTRVALTAAAVKTPEGHVLGLEGGVSALPNPAAPQPEVGAQELRFAHQVQHELRTPLNAIAGFAQIMREDLKGQADGRYASYCDDILSASNHLLGLIDDMVSAHGASQSGPALVPTQIDLATVFDEVGRLITPVAQRAGVSLVIEPPGADISCVTDRRKLKQILVNLLENAVKFTPRGASVGLQLGQRYAHQIDIVVWDEGKGIAEADQARIWQKFEKVGRTDEYTTGSPGLGLGLSVVKALADGLGARLQLESEVSRGTRFTISLPAVS